VRNGESIPCVSSVSGVWVLSIKLVTRGQNWGWCASVCTLFSEISLQKA
jgi:hypothetical protein